MLILFLYGLSNLSTFVRKERVMKKVKFVKLRKFIKGRGFAAALVLSITAVGTSAYFAYNGAVNRLSESTDPDFTQDAAAVGNPHGNVPRDEEQTQYALEPIDPPTSDTPAEPADPDAEEANNFVRPDSPKLMPVEGEVINPFSNGELVKSNTLGVWRTHDAVDIAAPLGTEVKAIQRGTVSEVYSNAMWGICITIDHGDGILSSYMGLDKDVKVEQGHEVQAGDVIGLVGNTAEAEIADPVSLHLAVRINDTWVDPIAYIDGRI
jgi:murein DD-endopeptidase MepM/ murein hydrolase activator NlpD